MTLDTDLSAAVLDDWDDELDDTTLDDLDDDQEPAGPYGQTIKAYRDAGWLGTLPLPPGQKSNPPYGYTGREGADPSWPDAQAWHDGEVTSTRSHKDADGVVHKVTDRWIGQYGNIALRLPRGVLGIDVDDYAGKAGASTLAALEARYGALPPTWTSTSRDGASGIRLYAVPEGLYWPGVLGPGIEVIQHRHRYLVAPPSVHPEGRTYRWVAPGTAGSGSSATPGGARWTSAPTGSGATSGSSPAPGAGTSSGPDLPSVADLPALPDAWIAGITGGQHEADIRRAGLDDAGVDAWLDARMDGEECERMVAVRSRHVQALLTSGESRHDRMVIATRALVGMAAEGHTGSGNALHAVHQAFELALSRAGDRAPDDGEWVRALTGAVDIAAAEHPGPPTSDPCTHNDLSSAVLDDTEEDTWTPDDSPAGGTESTPGVAGPLGTGTLELTSTCDVATADAAPKSSERASAGLTTDDPDLAADAQRWRLWQDAERANLLEEYQRQKRTRTVRTMLDDEEHAAGWRVPATFGTLADELALPEEPVQWRVADLLPAGGNVLLTAAFKAGKTSLVNALVQSLVDGALFLGQFAVERPRRVAVFNYEVGEQQYRRWLRDLDITNTADVSMLHLRGSRLPITTPRVEDWVVDWLGERDIDVWVVDPFARAFVGCGTSENDNTEVGRFLDTLDVIKDRAGVGELILPTHTGRAVADEGQERARGATRLDDWADVRWMLNRGKDEDEDTRYMRATGRDVDVEEGALKYDEDTRRMTFEGGQGRKGKQSRDIGDAILRAIEDHPGATKTIITREVGAKAENVRVAVERLVRAGMVRVVQGPGRSLMHYRQDVRGDLSNGLL